MTETAAYAPLGEGAFRASALTGGPWSPEHQHAGPPSALICRAVERAAAPHGQTHIGRLTVNLLRPAPIGDCEVDIRADHVGRGAAHFSGRLTSAGKAIALFTALAQREDDLPRPEGTPGHPPPAPPRPPEDSAPVSMGFAVDFGYARLVENRLARGEFFRGPSVVWFRLNHPLVAGEDASPYQRVAVAADSGNGISAALDFSKYMFVNCDLTINLFRRPLGEWICLDARSWIGENSCGLAESALYDEHGLIGRATRSKPSSSPARAISAASPCGARCRRRAGRWSGRSSFSTRWGRRNS
ncbi:MAG: thioesterase family protein [Pseudomonadota bacterium]|nr:thioesterase family protein [Pseudomonadota bacterium]